jgi:non-specific serine/threonine protein kinase
MVKNGGMKNKQQTIEAFRQIIDAVQFLHRHKIVHRDLSLENFFIAKDGSVKIGDFGQAKYVETDSEGKTKCLEKIGRNERPGKTGYQAPEIHENVPYDPMAADVFALGVSLFVALAKIPPFNRADRHDRCWKFVKQGSLVKLVNAWKLDMDEQTQHLIQGMLNPEADRFTMEQVRSHPFFEPADEVMAG